MPTLYVENVPEDLYEALRARAKKNRTSISAEVISALQFGVLTRNELNLRKKAIKTLRAMRKESSPARGPFPSSEELLREDRAR